MTQEQINKIELVRAGETEFKEALALNVHLGRTADDATREEKKTAINTAHAAYKTVLETNAEGCTHALELALQAKLVAVKCMYDGHDYSRARPISELSRMVANEYIASI